MFVRKESIKYIYFFIYCFTSAGQEPMRQEMVHQSRGCVQLPKDQDPGNGEVSPDDLNKLSGLVSSAIPGGNVESSVTGEAFFCSTNDCNSATNAHLSSVLCVFLISVALLVKHT